VAITLSLLMLHFSLNYQSNNERNEIDAETLQDLCLTLLFN